MMMQLENLKKEYEKLRKKYNLPSFQQLNEDFDVERLQEKETDTLSREVRRAMADKNLVYLRFIEMFINPSQAPMFFLVLVKALNIEQKKLLEELYARLGKCEVMSIALDNDYDEREDAEFIKKFYKEWQEIKKKFSALMEALEKSWEKKSEGKEKGYLG